jgi:hypothetical protein
MVYLFGFLLKGWSVGEMGEKPNSKEILWYRGDFICITEGGAPIAL